MQLKLNMKVEMYLLMCNHFIHISNLITILKFIYQLVSQWMITYASRPI